MSNEKLIIHWWEDSSGRHTCHKNVKGLSYDESYLGEIIKSENGCWYWKLKSLEETSLAVYPSMHEARRALELALNAIPLYA